MKTKARTNKLISALLTIAVMLGLFAAFPLTAHADLKNVNWTEHPQSQTVTEGDTVTFKASCTFTYTGSVTAVWLCKTTVHLEYFAAGDAPITFTATADMNGYKFRLKYESGSSWEYSNEAVLTVKSKAPVISKQPENKTGSGATSFAVTATGTGTLTYQWYVKEGSSSGWSSITDGGVYSGATTSTLKLSGAPGGSTQFSYYCKITNKNWRAESTTIDSASATLQTVPPPTITTQPASKTISAGQNTEFKVVASGSSLSYKWQYNNNGTWYDIGSDPRHYGKTTATLGLTDAPLSYSGTKYRCIVSNSSGGSVTSNAATLTVNAPTLTLSTSSWNSGMSAASTTINVTSNTNWTVSSSASWLTASKSGGSNNSSFTINTKLNTGTARSGTITVTGGGITQTVAVSQSGAEKAPNITVPLASITATTPTPTPKPTATPKPTVTPKPTATPPVTAPPVSSATDQPATNPTASEAAIAAVALDDSGGENPTEQDEPEDEPAEEPAQEPADNGGALPLLWILLGLLAAVFVVCGAAFLALRKKEKGQAQPILKEE